VFIVNFGDGGVGLAVVVIGNNGMAILDTLLNS